MLNHWSDRLGDWNPQLLRELKGKLSPRNVLLTIAASLLAQGLLLLSFYGQLPGVQRFNEYNVYCTGALREYSSYRDCVFDPVIGVVTNWQVWWLDIFKHFSIIGSFAIVVIGVFLLVEDLRREEQRATLNFVRLSPRSTAELMLGKIMGVPSLLYLFAALALPFHAASGLLAGVSPALLALFYVGAIASCAFFYSTAILFSLATTWIGGFQAWVATGFTGLLLITLNSATSGSPDVLDWLRLFNPNLLLPYVFNSANAGVKFSTGIDGFSQAHFYFIPVGAGAISAAAIALLNYGVWTYWMWQGIQRCFRNPNLSMLSKRQSYLIVACFEVLILGFAIAPPSWFNPKDADNWWRTQSLSLLLVLNLCLFMILIAALSPHRQTLQDWARYNHQAQERRQTRQAGFARFLVDPSLVMELIWGEKSPSLLAMAINAAIMVASLTPWVLLWPTDQMQGILSILFTANMIVLYAAIAQFALFMRTSKRILWAIGSVGSMLILFPFALGILHNIIGYASPLWLFSPVPWVAVKEVGQVTMLMTYLSQLGLLSLFSLQFSRQLKLAGESSSKALFGSPRSPVALLQTGID